LKQELERIKLIISEQFRYIGLPAGLNRERIEKLLIEYGQVAVFKRKIFYVKPFSVVEKNSYDEPKTIEVKGFGKINNFVVMKSDFTGLSLWRAISMDVSAKIEVETHLFLNIEDSRNKHLFVSKKPLSLMEKVVNTLRFSRNNYVPLALEMSQKDNINSARQNVRSLIDSDNSILTIEKIENVDRGQSLVSQYIFWENKIKEYCGLNINMLHAQDRNIQADLQQQQGVNVLIAESRFNCRKEAIFEINRIFKTNIKVEETNLLPIVEISDEGGKN